MTHWVNCEEQMPPDSDMLIIVKLSYVINYHAYYRNDGKTCDYAVMLARLFLNELHKYPPQANKFYTEYTDDKWAGLRVGALW